MNTCCTHTANQEYTCTCSVCYIHTGMVISKPQANGDYMTIEGNVGNRVKLVYRNTSRNPATFISCE